MDMRLEIIEAVTEYYKEDEDILTGCLAYLSNVPFFGVYTDDELESRGRCKSCGTKLIEYTYQEYHSEVDAYEDRCELVCPECDLF